MTEEARCVLLGEAINDIIAILEDRIGPSDDELVVLSGVVSYILCQHVSSAEQAKLALDAIGAQVIEIVEDADRTGNTMWVSGRGH
jgi:uncharacterized protein YejL (UPF0352 family)